jgi:hypothetical protein
MSIEFLAVESKFKQAKTEYDSMMKDIQTCYKNDSSRSCQRAAELNASMKTYVIEMSTLIVDAPKSIRDPKLREYNEIMKQLDRQLHSVLKEAVMVTDLQTISRQNKQYAILWFLCGFSLLGLMIMK